MAVAGAGNQPLACTFGMGTAPLVVTPSKIKVCGGSVATINDSVPYLNIPPLGMCISPANPAVAALIPVPPPGVIKPVPCVPRIPGNPWVGCSSKVRWGGQVPLTGDGCLTCEHGGIIKVVSPGKPKVSI